MDGFEKYLSRTKEEISVSACSAGGQPHRLQLREKPALCFHATWPTPMAAPPPSTSCSALLGIST